MPLYDYEILDKNGRPTGEVVEVFQFMRDEALTQIDGKPCRRRITGGKIERQWHGNEQRSFELAFDPSGYKALKKEVPDIELDEKGYVVYRNERHMRRVLKQIRQCAERYRQEEIEAAQRRAEEEDVDLEAAIRAINERYEGVGR